MQIESLKMLQQGKSLVHFGNIRLAASRELLAAANTYAAIAGYAEKLYRYYDDVNTRLVHYKERLVRLLFPRQKRIHNGDTLGKLVLPKP